MKTKYYHSNSKVDAISQHFQGLISFFFFDGFWSARGGWEPAGLLSLCTELELPRQQVLLLLCSRDTPAYISLGILRAQGLILQGQYLPWTREVLLHGKEGGVPEIYQWVWLLVISGMTMDQGF